jgi:hypothetical protein
MDPHDQGTAGGHLGGAHEDTAAKARRVNGTFRDKANASSEMAVVTARQGRGGRRRPVLRTINQQWGAAPFLHAQLRTRSTSSGLRVNPADPELTFLSIQWAGGEAKLRPFSASCTVRGLPTISPVLGVLARRDSPVTFVRAATHTESSGPDEAYGLRRRHPPLPHARLQGGAWPSPSSSGSCPCFDVRTKPKTSTVGATVNHWPRHTLALPFGNTPEKEEGCSFNSMNWGNGR